MELQTLGRRFVCPIVQATQRNILEIDGFYLDTKLGETPNVHSLKTFEKHTSSEVNSKVNLKLHTSHYALQLQTEYVNLSTAIHYTTFEMEFQWQHTILN